MTGISPEVREGIEAHVEYGTTNPAAMASALRAINAYHKGHNTLAHSIAVAIQAAYEAGTEGHPLEPADYSSFTVIKPVEVKRVERTRRVDGTISPELAKKSSKYVPPRPRMVRSAAPAAPVRATRIQRTR